MRISLRFALGVAVAAAWLGGISHAQEARGAAPAPAAPAGALPKGNAETGKTLFTQHGCYACHGYAGQGGAGARLAPNPPALARFIQLVRHPLNQMPPFTQKVLTDQQLADIHAYISTLPGPPDYTKIPLLNQKK